MAEGEESFVCGEGGFVVAIDPAAVVDSAVGGFDHPAWLEYGPVAGFGSGHDLDGDCGLGCGVDCWAGVAVVHSDMGDGRGDTFGLARQLGECGPVRHVGLGDDDG